jgi:hypothetical protein
MKNNDESITSNEHVPDIQFSDDQLSDDEHSAVTIVEKPKRIMSEKQLENLKRARGLAKIKLNLKKKETIESKKKMLELKLLQKLEKNQTIDMELNELKKKITIPREPEPEPEPGPEPEPETVLLPTAVQYTVPRSTKKRVKKVIYVSDSDSDIESEEEIVYKKKPSVKTKTKPIEDSELILKHQYNERMAQIKREFVMNQMFPN